MQIWLVGMQKKYVLNNHISNASHMVSGPQFEMSSMTLDYISKLIYILTTTA